MSRGLVGCAVYESGVVIIKLKANLSSTSHLTSQLELSLAKTGKVDPHLVKHSHSCWICLMIDEVTSHLMRWPQSCETASQQVRQPHYFEAASQLVPVSQFQNWWGDLPIGVTALQLLCSFTTDKVTLGGGKHPQNKWGCLTCEVDSKVGNHVWTGEAVSWLLRQPHKWSGSLATIEVTSQLWNSLWVSHMWGSLTFVMQNHNWWADMEKDQIFPRTHLSTMKISAKIYLTISRIIVEIIIYRL